MDITQRTFRKRNRPIISQNFAKKCGHRNTRLLSLCQSFHQRDYYTSKRSHVTSSLIQATLLSKVRISGKRSWSWSWYIVGQYEENGISDGHWKSRWPSYWMWFAKFKNLFWKHRMYATAESENAIAGSQRTNCIGPVWRNWRFNRSSEEPLMYQKSLVWIRKYGQNFLSDWHSLD